ncbi:MAG: hypothetical protein OXC11_03075 [Rhodospirillales bacterium]|nr:hypothetical protein [Rhodospirillales bacterium]
MQVQERLIVPGLGVVIFLATFILGVPLVYQVALGLLGLAAAGTYFAPQQVQVETRIAIAGLGLVILLIVISTAFWLTLVSFGAIAALQFPYRRELQRHPATFAWLSTVLRTARARRSGQVDGGGDAGEEAVAAAAAGDGESAQAPSPSGVGALPGFVRVNAAGIGGSVLGVPAMASVFLPWILFRIAAGGESESQSFTLWAAAGTLEIGEARAFFIILLVVGLVSIASVVLPRVVAAIIAAAGLAIAITRVLLPRRADGGCPARRAPAVGQREPAPQQRRTAGHRLLPVRIPAPTHSRLEQAQEGTTG